MKNVGIQWIDPIPNHWEVRKIGQMYKERRTKVSDIDYPPLSVTMKGIVPQLVTAAKTDAHDDRKLVKKGDFAINSRSDRRGSCGIAQQDGSVSLINTVLCPKKETNPEYLNWLFHTSLFADEFYRWGHGIVDDLWTTNWSDMKRIVIPFPSLPEQSRIAAFLDERCAKIDEAVARHDAIIKKLDEYKNALIVFFVTHGTRNYEMKPVDFDWFHEMPQEWGIALLSQLFAPVKCKNANLIETNLLSLSYGKIKQKDIDNNEGLVPANFEGYNIIENGDIVLRLTDLQNDQKSLRVGISTQRGIVTSAYVTIRPKQELCSKYFYYLLHSFDVCKGFYGMGGGIRQGLNWDELKFIKVLLPTFDEQVEIVAYLDEKCAAIDAAKERHTQIMAKLEEYKKSLIYNAVTGKIEC